MKATDKDFALSILNANERISVEKYSEMIQNNINHMLIDVRSPIEYEICHLENSINIPLPDIMEDKCLNKIMDYAKDSNTNGTNLYI